MEYNELIPDEEYETQFFGFAPTDFIIGLEELVKDHFKDALEILDKQMKKIPSNILPEDELTNGIEELRKQTNEHLGKVLLKLKNHLLEHVMKIPPHTILPEDTEQVSQHTDEEVKALHTTILELQHQLKNEKYVAAKLEEESIDIDKVLLSQKALLETNFNAEVQNSLDDAKDKLQFHATNSEQMVETFKNMKEHSNHVDWRKEMKNLFGTHVMS